MKVLPSKVKSFWFSLSECSQGFPESTLQHQYPNKCCRQQSSYDGSSDSQTVRFAHNMSDNARLTVCDAAHVALKVAGDLGVPGWSCSGCKKCIGKENRVVVCVIEGFLLV